MDKELKKHLNGLSDDFNKDSESLTVILAAGHGTRIKSNTSKMLHKIWGVPTVIRVHNSVRRAFSNSNILIVVGKKAYEVARVAGYIDKTRFVYQENQNGTGAALQVALESVKDIDRSEYTYVVPGDMGLIDKTTLSKFKNRFKSSNADMMVLTGIYKGKKDSNYYGRIIRAKKETIDNQKSKYTGDIIEIKEHKDILSLKNDYVVEFKGEKFLYTKDELLKIKEFNAGVYVFNSKYLNKYMKDIKNDNSQNEMYITDLIYIFNKNGLRVDAISTSDINAVLGFNNKSVLKQMEKIAMERIYQKIKDIITISDPEDFYIAEDIVDKIIKLDKKGVPLDIFIGKGAHISSGVKINYGLHIDNNVFIDGDVEFGKNVILRRHVCITTFEDQKVIIKDGVEILEGNMIKGCVTIKEKARLERNVNITGSDEYPTTIGKNVIIKGMSYIFGSTVKDNITIEHSVLLKKHIRAIKKVNGKIKSIRYVMPIPEGLDSIISLEDKKSMKYINNKNGS